MVDNKPLEEVKSEVVKSAVDMLTGQTPEEPVEIDLTEKAEDILDIVEDEEEEKEENEIIKEIFNEDKLNMITDISRKGAVTMAKAEILSDLFECEELRTFAKYIKGHLISNKRKGREELIEAFKTTLSDGMGMIEEPVNTSSKIWNRE